VSRGEGKGAEAVSDNPLFAGLSGIIRIVEIHDRTSPKEKKKV
jgi:hypothetical protein